MKLELNSNIDKRRLENKAILEHFGSRGFTLIEVMIAVVILTIGLLALVSVTVMVIKGNSLNRGITTATTIAKDQMETLKNTPFSSIVPDGYTAWSTVPDFSGYERRWKVTTSGNKKIIDMEVRWFWLGIEKKVTLNTIISS